MSLLWQYGTYFGRTARRHRFSGRLQNWPKYAGGYVNCAFPLLSHRFFIPDPGLKFWQRMVEWAKVIVEEHELTGSWPNPFKMVAKLFNGRVHPLRWRARMRICRKCPVFDGELKRCRGPGSVSKEWVHNPRTRDMYGRPITIAVDVGNPATGYWTRGLDLPPPGCGCYVPFLALTKTPYTSADGKRTGCWGRATIGPGFGWY